MCPIVFINSKWKNAPNINNKRDFLIQLYGKMLNIIQLEHQWKDVWKMSMLILALIISLLVVFGFF